MMFINFQQETVKKEIFSCSSRVITIVRLSHLELERKAKGKSKMETRQ